MKPRTCRYGGHTISGPADQTSAGRCIRCVRQNNEKYRRRLIADSHRLAAIQAALA